MAPPNPASQRRRRSAGGSFPPKMAKCIVTDIVLKDSQNSLSISADLVMQIRIAAFCLDQLSSQGRKLIHSSHMKDSLAILNSIVSVHK